MEHSRAQRLWESLVGTLIYDVSLHLFLSWVFVKWRLH